MNIKKRKSRKKRLKITEVLVFLGAIFSIVLFVLKFITARIGWLDVFAPVLIAFFLAFLLSSLGRVLSRL